MYNTASLYCILLFLFFTLSYLYNMYILGLYCTVLFCKLCNMIPCILRTANLCKAVSKTKETPGEHVYSVMNVLFFNFICRVLILHLC